MAEGNVKATDPHHTNRLIPMHTTIGCSKGRCPMKRMRVCILLPLMLAMLFILTACNTAADPFDPPDFTPTAAPIDWLTVDRPLHYVKNEAMSSQKVPIQSISLPGTQNLVKSLPDGGCLAITQVPVETDHEGTYLLQTVRFSADGTVQYKRSYDEAPFSGYLVSSCIFYDGGFAVSVRKTGIESQSDSVDWLYRFSPEGELIQKIEDKKLVAGALDHIVAITDDAILAAGTIATKGKDGSTNNNVCLSRIEKDGSLKKQVIVGTKGYEYLYDASYAEGLGFALSWLSEKDENHSDTSFKTIANIDCYDENLTKQWAVSMPEGANISKIIAYSKENGILAIGTVAKGDTAGTSYRSALFHLNGNGQRDWTYTVEGEKEWIGGTTMLSDGRYAIGIYLTETEGEVSKFIILSETGEPVKQLKALHGIVQELIPTREGGFTAILSQSLRALPQPPYVSSLWTDTEAVVVRFGSNLNVEWLRTIDQYKHSLQRDVVVVTSDDRLLIG